MRTLKIVYLSEKDIKNFNKIKEKKSLIFDYKNGKSFVYSHWKKWEEYNIELVKIDINEASLNDLAERILWIIKYSHEQVARYGKKLNPKENFNYVDEFHKFGKENPDQVLLSNIKQWLNYLDSNNMLDIFNICCWIPYKLLTNRHIWWNGNKRTSLATCINLLKSYKFYLSYSKDSGMSTDGKDRWYNLFTKYVRDDNNPKECVELNKEAYYELYKKFYSDIINGVYFDVYSIKEVKDE